MRERQARGEDNEERPGTKNPRMRDRTRQMAQMADGEGGRARGELRGRIEAKATRSTRSPQVDELSTPPECCGFLQHNDAAASHVRGGLEF